MVCSKNDFKFCLGPPGSLLIWDKIKNENQDQNLTTAHFDIATRTFDLQLALFMLKMQIASWFLRVAIFDFYQKVHREGSTDSSF